jgi:hypothetical protein
MAIVAYNNTIICGKDQVHLGFDLLPNEDPFLRDTVNDPNVAQVLVH